MIKYSPNSPHPPAASPMVSPRAFIIATCGISVAVADQCATTIANANAAASRLQSYYDDQKGVYNGGGRWTDANAVEDIHNLMLGAGTTTWDNVGNTWDVVQTAQSNPNEDWFSYNDGFNDDAQVGNT